MRAYLAVLPALGLGLLASVVTLSCYSERLPPPNFRYSCDVDGDCTSGEVCIRGLCQVPCTFATFETDCVPSSRGFVACINGTCANVCQLEGTDSCPSPQSCLDPMIDLSGAGGNPFASGSSSPLGVCGESCEVTGCPAGEGCIMGFCASVCESDLDCPVEFNFRCLPVGLCGPAELVADGETTGTTGTTTDESDGSTTEGSGDATSGGATE